MQTIHSPEPRDASKLGAAAPSTAASAEAAAASQPRPPSATSDSAEASPAQVTEPASPGASARKATPSLREWLGDLYVAALLVAVFFLDQATKNWVRNNIIPGRSIPEEGFFRLTHTTNTGGAFGFFPNQTVLLTLVSVVGIGILLVFFRRQAAQGRGSWVRTSLGLQLGGAAGNLVDRLTLGKVTDFIHVGAWPVFNIADSSIVVGIFVLAWLLYTSPKEPQPGPVTAPLDPQAVLFRSFQVAVYNPVLPPSLGPLPAFETGLPRGEHPVHGLPGLAEERASQPPP